MGTALLHRMLNTIEAHDQSPLIAQRALWRISRGMRDDDIRDTAHNLFDWFCEFNKSSLSEEDQALLDTDPNSIEDEQERKRLIRRQTKASKRARSAQRTFTSKATPELVDAVGLILNCGDDVAAADKLFFASACAPIMTPTELIDLLNRINECKASCSPSGGLSNVQRYVEQVRDLNVFDTPVAAAEGLWWVSHAPLSISREYQVQDMIAAACKLRGVSKSYKEEFPTYVNNVGKKPRKPDFDIFDPKSRVWERAAVQTSVELKPVADWKAAFTAITDAHAFICKRLNRGQTFQSIIEMMNERDAIVKRGDFELPGRAYIDETIGDCLVQTIVSTEELRANGTYMGNCTFSYKNAYQKGDGVLFRIILNGDTYNSDLRPNANGWKVREVKARHNGTNIPQAVKDVNNVLCRRLAGNP